MLSSRQILCFCSLAASLSCCRSAQLRYAQQLRTDLRQESDPRAPLVDHRKYKYGVLEENGLKVLAVEDKDAPKAGIAVAVEAGSYYDPESLPGLAHFCEHLLFLGTKKYPDEASFDAFLAKHDGTTNAFTEQERTVYFNEVSHAGFPEAMDRFAQFFIAPLFKGEMVGRELNAVDSEHKKNIPDQGRRMWELLRSTARNDSVVHRFYTGTKESLHGGDGKTVAALRAYHDANYCAPRMNLVMISNSTIEEQLRVAGERFGKVPRGSCSAPTDFGGSAMAAPFSAANLGRILELHTTSTPTLWMMVPLPPTASLYKEAPMQFVQYILGYAGPKSLISSLKQDGLVNDVSIQVDETSAATMVFLVYDLTAKGGSKNNMKDICGRTFHYLQGVVASDENGSFFRIYRSLQNMSWVSFDYTEPPDSVMDSVSGLARAMAQYKPEDVLLGMNGVIKDVDTDKAIELLTFMSNPSHANIAFAHGEFDDASATSFEQYYGIHYTDQPVPQEWLQAWSTMYVRGEDVAALPPALRFVPTSLTLRKATEQKIPEKLPVIGQQETGNVDLWWKGPGEFGVPKAQLRLKLSFPVQPSPEQAALRQLHAEVVQESLEEVTEDFRNCGIDFTLLATGTGYSIDAAGYDQHLDSILVEVLGALFTTSASRVSFLRARAKLVDQLNDTARYAPYQLAMDALSALTTDTAFSREEVLSALQKQTEERLLQQHLSWLQSADVRVQLLVVGNIDRAGAQRIAETVLKPVVENESSRRLVGKADVQQAHALVVGHPVEVRLANPIPGDVNHATIVAYQYGVPDIAERVKLLLISKIVEGPIFEKLRTQKQLGYVVSGFVTEHVSILELRVLVQGAKETPDVVAGAIDEVLVEIGQNMSSMPHSEFEQWKAALRSALSHKDQNMAQETDRFWQQIASDSECFDRKKLALEYLETLNRSSEVADIFLQMQKRNRVVRVKLFAEMSGQSKAPGTDTTELLLHGASTSDKQKVIASAGADHVYPSQGVCQ